MSCDRTDRIRARLLEGIGLTSEERRHVATCPACGRAAADVERLDARLREAARLLAVEPIPNEVLDVTPADPSPLPRLAAGAGLGAVAAVAIVLAVVALGGTRAPVAVDPTPTSSPTPGVVPSGSPEPWTPTPSPLPTPPLAAPEVDPHLVGPLGACADGSAGFSVFLPSGWYANRAAGEQAACRTIGPVRDLRGRQILDPAIYVDVADEPPRFEGAIIEDEVERTLPSGVTVTRMTVHMPETGALAASDEVVYLAPLAEGRTLVARTDARRGAWVTALDAIIERLEVREPIVIDPAAVTDAERLFADRDVCEDPERGLAVVFPDAWWTNTAVDDLPACSWFAPSFFAFVSSDAAPDEVEITLELLPGDYGTWSEVVGWDSVTVLDRPATRWIVDTPDGRSYDYVVQLGEIAEFGPTLVASTMAASGDMDLAMAVLDELVERMTMADPPPGAKSAEPYIDGDPISAKATDDGFRLELVVDQDRYRAGQPILADVTLTYLGDEPVRVWGSGHSLIGTTVRQLDGPIDPGMAFTTDCAAYDISPGDPMRSAVGKSGSFDGDDPLAEWYEAYFRDPLLRLPPGRWELVAATSFTVGGDDCGSGPAVDLRATVEIVVEP